MTESEFPTGVLKRAAWCHLAGIAWFAIGLLQNTLSLLSSAFIGLFGITSAAQGLGIIFYGLTILLSLLAFPFISGFLYALIMWKTSRGVHPFVDDCGKAATNFQATMGLYSFCAFLIVALLALVTCGPVWADFNLYGDGNQTTETLALIGLGVIGLSLVGAFAWSIFQVVVTIMGAVKASKGQLYVYPLSRQFYS